VLTVGTVEALGKTLAGVSPIGGVAELHDTVMKRITPRMRRDGCTYGSVRVQPDGP